MIKDCFIVAQMGARRHYAIPRMLHNAGMLDHLYTDICSRKGWPRVFNYIPGNLLPNSLKRLKNRIPRDVPASKITAFSNIGFLYALERTKKFQADDAVGLHLKYAKKFCSRLLNLKFNDDSMIYTFNSAGLELMRVAKKKGISVVMEQTIAPRRIELNILERACRKYPEWSIQIANGPYTREYIEREEAEWELADLILCGSGFVKEGVANAGGPVHKCEVVPYGVDDSFGNFGRYSPRQKGPLRVLTVGAVGLRKGSPDIFLAASMVGKACQFRLVGPLQLPPSIMREVPENVKLVGSVPRSEISDHLKWADVFLLPSLCEGSAMAIYEALSFGVPVICTRNSGSIIEEGRSGFVVPILSPEKIAEQLLKFYDDKKMLFVVAENIRKEYRNINMISYQERFYSVINNLKYDALS